jgi:hypothetical protein
MLGLGWPTDQPGLSERGHALVRVLNDDPDPSQFVKSPGVDARVASWRKTMLKSRSLAS